jgi:hypothetical protein
MLTLSGSSGPPLAALPVSVEARCRIRDIRVVAVPVTTRCGVGAQPAYSPNTNSIVALPWDLSSGERAILALPTGPMPEAMAMYCLPFAA